jgi:hypothetical protein
MALHGKRPFPIWSSPAPTAYSRWGWRCSSLARLNDCQDLPDRESVRWVTRILVTGIGVIALVVVPWFPLAWLAGGAAWLSERLFRSVVRRAGRVVFIEVWPRVALFVAYGAVVSGIAGFLPSVTADDYHFTPQVAAMIPDGRYVQIAENGQTIFLEVGGPPRRWVRAKGCPADSPVLIRYGLTESSAAFGALVCFDQRSRPRSRVMNAAFPAVYAPRLSGNSSAS